MKIAAIVAEYNPFHSGHKYQIEETRRITGCDYVIAVISGDFVQRGEPAVMDKFLRTRCALENGIDAVVELPVRFATASAEGFACGAVSLLDALGCVDYLCFGSECGNIALLSLIANILTEEPKAYTVALKECLKKGRSYPAARAQALCDLLYAGETRCSRENRYNYTVHQGLPEDQEAFMHFLEQPNNILGIEYLKALKRLKSSIQPVTITRVGSGYHDRDISEEFCSATALRDMLRNFPLSDASLCMPRATSKYIQQEYGHTLPIFSEDFSLLLHYALLRIKSYEDLLAYQDISEDLAKRILSLIPQYQNYASFVSLIKTRNYTEATVRRALLHVLLALLCVAPNTIDISDKYEISAFHGSAYYARLLGFCKSADVLSEIKKSSRIPILSKPANACCVLNEFYADNTDALSHALSQFAETVKASEIWHAVCTSKFGGAAYHEYRHSPIIL